MSKQIKFTLLGVPVFVYFLTIYFFSFEQNIYFWDFKLYWTIWQSTTQALNADWQQALHWVNMTVQNADYNAVSILIPAVIASIFSLETNRITYLLLLNLCYLVPVIWLFYGLLRSTLLKNVENYVHILSIVLITFFTSFWVPSLRGMPDIIGIIFVILSTYWVINRNFTLKITPINALILGVLLYAPFLLRRWYAYTVVTLYLTLPVLNYFYYQSKLQFKNIVFLLINFAIAGVITIGLAWYFQLPLLQRIIATDYSNIYSAYQDGLLASFITLYQGFGLSPTLLMLVGLVSIPFVEKYNRLFMLVVLVNLVVSFLLLTRTQSPGAHHLLPFHLWAFILTIGGMLFILQCINSKKGIIFSILFTGGFVLIYHLTFHQYQIKDEWKWLLPIQVKPFSFKNIANYQKLADDVVKLTQNGGKLTVLSSSYTLNDEILDTLSNFQLKARNNEITHVDLRDRWRLGQFQSHYLIFADSKQTHRNSGQELFQLWAKEFENNSSIAKAYRRLPQYYELDNGAVAYIYEKTRAFNTSELEEFFTKVYKIHPDWYQPQADQLLKLLASLRENTVEHSQYAMQPNGSLVMTLSNTDMRIVNANLNYFPLVKVEALSSPQCVNLQPITLIIANGSGNVVGQQNLAPQTATQINLVEMNRENINIAIAPYSMPQCMQVRLSFSH